MEKKKIEELEVKWSKEQDFPFSKQAKLQMNGDSKTINMITEKVEDANGLTMVTSNLVTIYMDYPAYVQDVRSCIKLESHSSQIPAENSSA